LGEPYKTVVRESIDYAVFMDGEQLIVVAFNKDDVANNIEMAFIKDASFN
jgi:hypothetical protein